MLPKGGRLSCNDHGTDHTYIYPRSNDLRSGGNSYTRLAMSEIDIFSENVLSAWIT